MSTILAIADDRYRKRPVLYESFASQINAYAMKKESDTLCLYFTRDRSIPVSLKKNFKKIITADSRFLTTNTDLNPLFEHVLKNTKISAILVLHHKRLESFLVSRTKDRSHIFFDVCDIQQHGDETLLYMPRFNFRCFTTTLLTQGSLVFIRTLATPSLSTNECKAEQEHYAHRFGSLTALKQREIHTNFSVITGKALYDNKYFVRYCVSIGDKMKGASLATESLCTIDDSISANSCAERCHSIETDFCIIAGEFGNYDLLEIAMAQRFVVYVGDDTTSPLLLSADEVILEHTPEFLEQFNKRLKKVSFKAKKINKKL